MNDGWLTISKEESNEIAASVTIDNFPNIMEMYLNDAYDMGTRDEEKRTKCAFVIMFIAFTIIYWLTTLFILTRAHRTYTLNDWQQIVNCSNEKNIENGITSNPNFDNLIVDCLNSIK